MKKLSNVPPVERNKVIAIMSLLITSILIILFGATFCIFSFVNNMNFTILKSQIHGSIFGLIIIFLGVRYFLSVLKLKEEVYKISSRFSWSNFKKEHKDLSKSR